MATSYSSDCDEIEEVCSFLRSRNIEEQTIRNFKEQKMDFQAIVMSSAEDLQQLGCVRGDAMNMKHFAETKLREMERVSGQGERKRLLEEVLSQGAKARVKPPSKVNVSRKKPVRKVNIGWFHFNEATQTYVQVKTQKGGGTRAVDLLMLATKEVIVSTGINCFFPNGSSTFGSSDEMEFSISNFQQQEIIDEDGFTLQKYVEQFKLKRITLYLLSRRKQNPQPCSATLFSDSDSDLEKSVFDTGTAHQTNQCNLSTEILAERRRLIAKQNEEFLKSLETDREKENVKKRKLDEEVENAKRQEEIMLARKARVPEEPRPEEEKLVVRVRHVTCGVVERAFKPNTMMSAVYDWVGSLTMTPENFVLSNYKCDLMPDEPIQAIALHSASIVLNMRQSQYMPPLGEDVNFKGFGDRAIDMDSTASDLSLVSPTERVPGQLMADDTSSDGSILERDVPNGTDSQPGGHSTVNQVPDYSYNVSRYPEITAPCENDGDQNNHLDGSTSNDDSDSSSSLGDPSAAAFQPPFSSFVGNGQDVRDRGWHFRRWLNEIVENRSENHRHDGVQDKDILQAEVRRITVRRDDILQTVLKLYMEDDDIVKRRLVIHFAGEKGIDFGGLTKDFFTSFWEAAFAEYFDGDVVKVPLVSPQKLGNRPVIQALGRILEHGWKLTGELPVRFCEASVIGVLHGEDAVPDDALERSFLWYITQFERDILCSALEGGKVDEYKKDALLGLYRRFSMQCLPATSENKLHEQILAMARCEFLHKPMAILSWMRSGITELDSFRKNLTVQKVCEVYKVLSPTSENVLKNMRPECEDLRPEEERAYNFLTIYIGSMDGDQLLKFLHFVTGSTVTPVGKGIKVCFNAAQGLSRAPSASTCSNTLTISTTYETYAQFKKELSQFLSGDEIFEMSVL